MEAKPCHNGVGEKKRRHAAQGPLSREALWTGGRHERNASEDEAQVPKVEHFRIPET